MPYGYGKNELISYSSDIEDNIEPFPTSELFLKYCNICSLDIPKCASTSSTTSDVNEERKKTKML